MNVLCVVCGMLRFFLPFDLVFWAFVVVACFVVVCCVLCVVFCFLFVVC